MKKAIYTLGILALAAFSVASCQKRLTPDDGQEGKLVTVTFVADNQSTKSGILNEGESTVSYKWTDIDKSIIRLYTVSEGILTRVEGISAKISSDGTLLTITATVEEGSRVRAVLSSSFNYSEQLIFSTTTQTPRVSTFDPTADVLVSEDEVVTAGQTEFSLVFHRQLVVCKMTLTGLPSGEEIQQIILTSTSSEKMLSGSLPMAGGDWTGTGSKLTLGLDPEIEYPSDTLPLYFMMIPNEDIQLHIKVITNLNVYEKDLARTVSFKLGQFTKFSVALPSGTPLVGDAYSWVLADGDWNGTNFGGIKMFNDKGTPAMDWMSLWSGSNTPVYGWDAEKGMKVGSDTALCDQFLLMTNDDPVNIHSVRVCFAGEGATLSVKAGPFETPMSYGEGKSVAGTANPVNYTFTCDGFLQGEVKIFVDDVSGPFYIKSIEFNPTT